MPLATRIAVIVTMAACAPPPAQLVTEQRWPAACALRGDDARELERVVLAAIAPHVSLDVQVLDRDALERELGIPVAGTLFDRIAIIRFSAHADASILHADRIEPIAIGDGRSIGFGRRPTPVRTLDSFDEAMFEPSHEAVSKRGMAALFLSPDGLPDFAAPLSRSIFDHVPVPLGGGATVETFRRRSSAEAGRDAVSARNAALDERAAALDADPVSRAAVAELRAHLAKHEWYLLLPGSDTRGFSVMISSSLGGACHLDSTVGIDLAGDGSPAGSLNGLFSHPRLLADLPYKVL